MAFQDLAPQLFVLIRSYTNNTDYKELNLCCNEFMHYGPPRNEKFFRNCGHWAFNNIQSFSWCNHIQCWKLVFATGLVTIHNSNDRAKLLLERAVRHCDVECLRLVRRFLCPTAEHVKFIQRRTTREAMFIGNYLVLQCLYNEFGIHRKVFRYAMISSMNGDTTLRFLLDIGAYSLDTLYRDRLVLIRQAAQTGNALALSFVYHNVMLALNRPDFGGSRAQILEDFTYDDNALLRWTESLDVLKFVFHEVGLSADDFRAMDNFALRKAFRDDRLDILEFFHETVHLDISDFRAKDNAGLRAAAANGSVDVLKFLLKNVQLTKDDFRSRYNEAIGTAVIYNHLNVLQFLFYDVQLSKEDFGDILANAVHNATIYEHFKILRFLCCEVGLDLEHIRSVCPSSVLNDDTDCSIFLREFLDLQ